MTKLTPLGQAIASIVGEQDPTWSILEEGFPPRQRIITSYPLDPETQSKIRQLTFDLAPAAYPIDITFEVAKRRLS